jgi:signal peptidase II
VTTIRPDGTTASEEPAAKRPAGRTASVGVAVGVLLGVAAVLIAIDQWTKHLVVADLDPESPVRALGGLLYLDLTFNSGAAFSFGRNYTFVFPVIAIVISGVILWLARGLRSWPWAAAMGLVLGGAVGNLIDRLFRAPGPFRGNVVDFLSVFAPDAKYFPIFNVADSALTIGVILAIALELFGFRRDGMRLLAQRPADDQPGA